ncbi:hypothetical protein BN2537_16941 [Streptomyces venezuelae]|nr:hypothetical protein BN2537_16941 [Streptomyces venezuelae]
MLKSEDDVAPAGPQQHRRWRRAGGKARALSRPASLSSA